MTGRSDRVPSGPVTRHVQLLRQTMSVTEIAKRAGIGHDNVRRALLGTNPTISRRIATKLLAVPRAALTEKNNGRVDGTGSRRRLQALHAIGWTSAALAREMSIDGREAWRRLRAPTVYATTRAAIVELYDRLWDQPPPVRNRYEAQACARAISTAKKAGWPPPMAWDDDTIDDPDATPEGIGEETKAAALDTAFELAEMGLGREEILAQIGLKWKTFYQQLRRANRVGEWDEMMKGRAA